MTVSISEMDNRVFMGLSAAAEFLSLTDVHNVVVQKHGIRTQQSRSSDTNVLLGLSSEFTPLVTPYDITALIGKSVPCWLEVKSLTLTGVDWWYPVRVVPLDQLNDYQQMGMFAIAFEGREPDSLTAQATQYLHFTYLPQAVCRIHFDRDSTRIALAANTLLPDNLTELVVLESQNALIPRINAEIVMRMRRDPVLKEIGPPLIAALTAIANQNRMSEIPPLEAEWKIWSYRDRSGQTSFNQPTPRPKTQYGDENWSGYFGGGY